MSLVIVLINMQKLFNNFLLFILETEKNEDKSFIFVRNL